MAYFDCQKAMSTLPSCKAKSLDWKDVQDVKIESDKG